MDFFQIHTKETKGILEVRPDFVVERTKDLMVRGQSFYAVWDPSIEMWSTDEYDVRRIVDEAIREFVEKQTANGIACTPKYLQLFSNGGWAQFKKYMKHIADNSYQLDTKLTFADTKVKRSDRASRRLPYSLVLGAKCPPAWDELVGTLYAPEEREKIEWAIGAIVAGDSKTIQKFLVLYGAPGAGKGTILDVIFKLFGGMTTDGGYCTVFVAQDLVGSNSNFATEPFKDNPLVGIQFDGDLSRIEDNSKLNAIVSHEPMRMNEKFKPTYTTKVITTLFMGTNSPVQITNAKSGIVRRLIDVVPSGRHLETNRYQAVVSQIDFELGAIASHCLEVYRSLGKNAYSNYKPMNMIRQTDAFWNFVDEHSDIFQEQNSTTLTQAYTMYKEYCDNAELKYRLVKYKFAEELKNYFESFYDRTMVDGIQTRSYYEGFIGAKLKPLEQPVSRPTSLVLEETVSLLDEMYPDQPAQYPNRAQNPAKYWDDSERDIDGEMKKPRPNQVCSTVLSDLDTSKLHFVKLPPKHVVVDFDLKDDDGRKSLEKNLEAAALLPPTYTELSKSGAGVHKHYFYEGDVEKLAALYAEDVEVKVFSGNASLRRKLSKCNNIPVATINSGLPLKEKKNVLTANKIQSERGLREMIARNLNREYHDSTKPSIDFVKKILDDVYASGMQYDVTDMRQHLIRFANDSSNQPLLCLKTVQKMKFKSEGAVEAVKPTAPSLVDKPIVVFDVEVFPNLFVVCWSYEDSDTVVRMINPTAKEIEQLIFNTKLIGFYNRQYDNHILYAAYMGYNNHQLYVLSKKIIARDRKAMFGAAYSLSYADIYDFASIKMSLKRWEIELGIHHMELNFPWDEPVDEKDWDKVVEYCVNDVVATKAVLKDRRQDLIARQILADMSGLTVNDTTRQHSTKIIFGDVKNPQKDFVYTDLSEEFPGYEFDEFAKGGENSTYKGVVVGEGGYVYAEPGIHENVALLDVASMHPTSIEQLNLFGPYTKKYSALKEARLSIKDGDFEYAAGLLEGKLRPHLEEIIREANRLFETGKYAYFKEALAAASKPLSDALKLVINETYGYTMAGFPTEFKDPRNKDNIVAKRGALFMIDLKEFVESKGFIVAHIKTDSIKIPDANAEIIKAVKEFGKRYGYEFNHEATYQKMCLVNNAVFIAKVAGFGESSAPEGNSKNFDSYWKATGLQFQVPYVFKTLFSGDPIKFEDVCVAKEVQNGAVMFLDFDEKQATPATPDEGMAFVGKTGLFVPVKQGGGNLVRVKDEKAGAVGGTKGHKWLEAEVFKSKHKIDSAFFDVEAYEDVIDMNYFTDLAHDAIAAIEEYGDFEEFVK